MSWQCPICETVNQDVTPVCTVCDSIAPVIESYLSLEAIERIRKYNEILDIIHTFEIEKAYKKMLTASLEAISLYKENKIAIEKARQALIYLQRETLEENLSNLLDNALDKKDFNKASSIINLANSLEIATDKLDHKINDINLKLSRIREVDHLLEDSYQSLINYKIEHALKIIEEGMIKHTNSKRLKIRRDEIKNFAAKLQEKKSKNKIFFPPKERKEINYDKEPIRLEENTTQRKFPKVKRK